MNYFIYFTSITGMSERFELLLHVCVHVGVSYCHLLLKNQSNHPIESSQLKADLGVLGFSYFGQHHKCNPVERISLFI